MSSTKLPEFERPPVIETVLGVQFVPPEGFQNAHLGLFWNRLGRDLWPHATNATLIPEQFERFGEIAWGGGLQIQLSQDVSSRLQIRNAAGDRMIQIQKNRLHYNWLRQAGKEYPRYPQVKPEFEQVLSKLQSFLLAENLGALTLNQWEVTYINHVPKGELWTEPRDHGKVVLFAVPSVVPHTTRLETLEGEWHYEILPQRGRLHVQIMHGRRGTTGPEVLALTLTARGPLDSDGDPLAKAGAGIDLGRETIVQAFKDITSSEAHAHWGLYGNR